MCRGKNILEEIKKVSNPGSALGEAIGVLMENALNRKIKPIVEALGYVYISTGPINPKTGKNTKLKLKDEYGIEYAIDSLIVNTSLQPIVIIESKYIRYKKHNRDKGSWIKSSHTAIRERFSSIRSSMAVLAGSWSAPSKAMMRSADITIFEIPFNVLCEILREYNIEFEWDEKDRTAAYKAWNTFCQLSEEVHNEIGDKIISHVFEELSETITKILDNSIEREITEVEVHVTTNFGEVKIFRFDSVESAIEFLQQLDTEEIISTENSPSLLDDMPLFSKQSSLEE
jgi:hypothetical protein